MKVYLKRLFICVSVIALIISNATYAHSGRTDSSGGHRDNKNKSGLGSYHYHCGGHEAHLHPNGVCPYSSSSNKKNNDSSSDSSNSKNKIQKSTTISVDRIEINESQKDLYVGETSKLTKSIFPTNATDQKVSWKSSDENVVTISESGTIIAKEIGSATITVSTSNGKNDSIVIKVKRKEEEKNNRVINTLVDVNNNKISTNSNSKNSDSVTGIIILGAIGGISYWSYRKYKNDKKK